MKRILILSANPHDTNWLRLDKEARDIREGLKLSGVQDQFEVVYEGSVRPRDFYRQLLDVKPNFVHFSGHGAGKHGLVLEDNNGKSFFLKTEQIAETFRLFSGDGLECVVLNACFSEVQAKAINQSIPYVIGMNDAIGDSAAVEFAVAFYSALGSGRNIDFSFGLAKAQLISFEENQKPALLINSVARDRLESESFVKQPASASKSQEKSIDLSGSQGAILDGGTGNAYNQQFGNTTNINTGGGNYAGGSISK